MANKSITIDDAILAKVMAWADRPTENRTLSNAIESLCRRALAEIEREEAK
jgi:Arc/MetJ family transcription regulator